MSAASEVLRNFDETIALAKREYERAVEALVDAIIAGSAVQIFRAQHNLNAHIATYAYAMRDRARFLEASPPRPQA